ncbi:MAG: FAD-dependent oxidoreductase [Treponema sp.]|jgi:nitrite reductase (NADH) large subunit|nr:FAD-dependent oxidoreductase [Treponema sp.]
MKRYVIIGNGIAGASAVEQIRARDKDGKITIFTKERHPFYYRPRLPEYMTGETSLDKFTMHPLSKYEQWNVDLRLGETVTAIDAAKREVSGEKSGVAPYDELLLATGSSCFVPPVTGSGKPGVFTLRILDDADAIAAAAKKAKTAILVGGGLLGLETGRALIKLGLSVEVVEFADRLLPRQIDSRGAALLQKMLAGMGFSFHLDARTKEITGEPAVDGLELADGNRIDGELLVFSAGVRPNLELARAAGLAINKAIKVDEYMRTYDLQTAVPGIWAAGDAAEFAGQPCGIWPIAMAQGKAAGASMAGELSAYVPQAPSTSLKVAGISLTSVGNIDAENKLRAKCFVSDTVYRKIVLEEDIIKGIIFLGSEKGIKECTAAMNRNRHLGALAEQLDREDFDFSRLL